MRKKKVLRKGAALALVCALGAGMFALADRETAAADAIDTDAACSLTLQMSSAEFRADLAGKGITVNVYRVADVTAAGKYELTEAFGGSTDLSGHLAGISSATTAEDWETYSQEAYAVVETAEAAGSEVAQPTGCPAKMAVTADSGAVTVQNLKPGLYLVAPAAVDSVYYRYTFTPFLSALPYNYYYSGGEDNWVYDLSVDLKVGRERLYGSLEITKTLENYNSLTQEGYFVFQVEGKNEAGDIEYSNTVSLTFTEEGSQTAALEIPSGLTVTVTEVYSGASYEVTSDRTVTLAGPVKAEEVSTVSFTNDYNEKLIPGTGVLNHFTAAQADDGTLRWNGGQVDAGNE